MSVEQNILITSTGKRCQLIECFRNSARKLDLNPLIIAADFNPSMSPACHLADKSIQVPRCTDPTYIETLLEICQKNDIVLIVPTIDTELLALAEAKSKFTTHNITLVVSTPQAIQLSQNKLATAQTLSKANVPTPKTSALSDFSSDQSDWNYPLIFKPNSGSNSQGLKWAMNVSEIPYIECPQDYIVQECLKGKEYTTNCYFDKEGKLLATVPHERIEVRGGEVSKAVTRRIPQLEVIARGIESLNIGWHGPICFQTIESEGTHYLFEINARFGGGYPIAHEAGAQFTKWLILESLGREIPPIQEWKANLKMLRYDSAVYSDD